jgi:hypothetical protein
MKTVNGYTIELTHEALTIEGTVIDLTARQERLPEFERSNRREELLLAIAAICAEEYGLNLAENVNDPNPIASLAILLLMLIVGLSIVILLGILN